MADYTSQIYLDDIEFDDEPEYTFTETCTATIINTPSTPTLLDTECGCETHIHNTGVVPICDIVIGEELIDTITNTPVTPVLMDILLADTGTIHNHTPEISVALTTIVSGTIYNYSPSISSAESPLILGEFDEIDPPLPDPSAEALLLISGKVNVAMNDKMYRATLEFETAAEAFLTDVSFKNTQIIIPDYLGTQRLVFYGLIPSSGATLAVAADKCSLTAYDYAWYLTMQYLTLADRVLLSLDEQVATLIYRENYDYCTDPYLNFAEGDIVTGSITGHSGKVIENHFSGYMGEGYLILGDMTGTMIAGHYFQDDENLQVNGVTIAAADGYTMDVSNPLVQYYPDDWVIRVLGGANWEKTTGIYPYRIASTATLWNTIQRTFTFEEKETKYQAIERVAKYLGYIFYVKWQYIPGNLTYMPLAYFIPLDEIDDLIVNGDLTNGLDLPRSDPVNIVVLTPNDFVSPATYEEKGDEKYSRVTVKCQDLNGIWYTSKLETDPVKYGEEIPVEYFEINQDIASQSECDQRCSDLFTYYAVHIKKWQVTLLARSDLVLYQKVNLGAFGTEIPTGNYRIIGIEYSYANGGIENLTRISIISDAQFHAYLNISRTFTDTISNTRAIIKDELTKLGAVEAGTVTAIDGSTITVMTESGTTRIVRDPTV